MQDLKTRIQKPLYRLQYQNFLSKLWTRPQEESRASPSTSLYLQVHTIFQTSTRTKISTYLLLDLAWPLCQSLNKLVLETTSLKEQEELKTHILYYSHWEVYKFLVLFLILALMEIATQLAWQTKIINLLSSSWLITLVSCSRDSRVLLKLLYNKLMELNQQETFLEISKWTKIVILVN